MPKVKKDKKHIGSILDPLKSTTREEWKTKIFGGDNEEQKGEGAKKLTKLSSEEIKIKQILPLLCMLCEDIHENETQRHAIIDHMNDKQLNQIKDYMNDFLQEKFKLPNELKRKIKKDKEFVYKLASEKIDNEEKKRVLKQKGGFLPLAALAATPLFGLLSSTILQPVIKGAVDKLFRSPAVKKE